MGCSHVPLAYNKYKTFICTFSRQWLLHHLKCVGWFDAIGPSRISSARASCKFADSSLWWPWGSLDILGLPFKVSPVPILPCVVRAERKDLDLLNPHALHIRLLPWRRQVGVFVVPHSAHICNRHLLRALLASQLLYSNATCHNSWAERPQVSRYKAAHFRTWSKIIEISSSNNNILQEFADKP